MENAVAEEQATKFNRIYNEIIRCELAATGQTPGELNYAILQQLAQDALDREERGSTQAMPLL